MYLYILTTRVGIKSDTMTDDDDDGGEEGFPTTTHRTTKKILFVRVQCGQSQSLLTLVH